MLTFVAFKWSQPGYPTQYSARHVNRWVAMVRRFYTGPKRFVLVTDDPEGVDPIVRIVPLWDDYSRMRNRHGDKYPACHRRLRIWAADAADLIGERIVMMDLDCSIVGSLNPLLDRDEDVVLWRDPNPPTQYNGGLVLLRAGSRPQVWEQFKGAETAIAAASFRGSDQAVLSLLLGPGEAVWTDADGVLSFKKHVRGRPVPANARVVLFHGRPKPWDATVPEWLR